MTTDKFFPGQPIFNPKILIGIMKAPGSHALSVNSLTRYVWLQKVPFNPQAPGQKDSDSDSDSDSCLFNVNRVHYVYVCMFMCVCEDYCMQKEKNRLPWYVVYVCEYMHECLFMCVSPFARSLCSSIAVSNLINFVYLKCVHV